ncbi:hypothetical protein pb186bvf_021149 [Paramecium bursaria]
MDNSDILEQAFLDDAKVAESENQSNQPQQDANGKYPTLLSKPTSPTSPTPLKFKVFLKTLQMPQVVRIQVQ